MGFGMSKESLSATRTKMILRTSQIPLMPEEKNVIIIIIIHIHHISMKYAFLPNKITLIELEECLD